MNIISGTAVPVNLMVLQPENGRTLYSLTGVEWGALNDAAENRDRYIWQCLAVLDHILQLQLFQILVGS